VPHATHDPFTQSWATPQAPQLASAPPDELLLPPLEELEPLEDPAPLLLLLEALLPASTPPLLLEDALLPPEELAPLLLDEALLPDEELALPLLLLPAPELEPLLAPLDEPDPLEDTVPSPPASPLEDPLAPDELASEVPPDVLPAPDELAVPEDPLVPDEAPAPDDPLVLAPTPLEEPEEAPPLETPSSVASAPFRLLPPEVELPPQAAASVDASQTERPRERSLRTFADRVAPMALFTASPSRLSRSDQRARNADPRVDLPSPRYSLLHHACYATRPLASPLFTL
jgi:hypothetical protein